jgi:EpsD family peptidyl-prolyl cis-trans isomerase
MTLTMLDAPARRWLPMAAVMMALALALALVGCGDKKDRATQTAARVNKDEITVHEINFVLEQQHGLQQSQADAASRQVLQRLIDQQLALQQAEDQKLDRDPRVVQALEAARREIIARAYLEKVGEAATKPTPEEIKKYYDDNPALFSDRRVYNLQEITIEAQPDQVDELKQQLTASKSVNDFVEYLKSHDYHFSGAQAVRAAEQLPLNSLATFSHMKDGQAMVAPAKSGVQVVVLAGSRSQPVTEEQVRPAIEHFLVNERKRKLIEQKIKDLRATAKIEYMGKFATAAASAAEEGEAAASEPVLETVPLAAPASGGLTGSDISKGMGLK